MQAGNLTARKPKDCGECSKHNMTHTPAYTSWAAMNNRCSNPKNPNFPKYGGRGIRVCKRWAESFTAFLSDMGERPSLDFTLDRINPNGNYEPSNCRWASKQVQRVNQRAGIRGRKLEFQGERMSIRAWAAKLGIDERTLGYRIRSGWPIEKALASAVAQGKSRGGKASQVLRKRSA